MLGAIIGDLAGSIYEYEQTKNHKPIQINNIIEDNAFISDDSILTMAIADAIINKKDYGQTLKDYALKYQDHLPQYKPYFKTVFSPRFIKWAKSDLQGTSTGNGAMMRVSPVGYLFDTEEDVIKNSYLATIPSHNTPEAINYAKTIALIIFYIRNGYSKQDIIKKLDLNIRKPEINSFNSTCANTIDLCLYSLFNSTSFEDSIKLAISFGGDTDTNACIVGSMAEAMYGIDSTLKEKAISYLPNEFKHILQECYTRTTQSEREL